MGVRLSPAILVFCSTGPFSAFIPSLGEPMNFNGCFNSIWHRRKASLHSLANYSLRRVRSRNRPISLCCSTGPFSASAILSGMLKNFSDPLVAHGTSGSLFAHFGDFESFRPVATGSAQSYVFYFALQVRFRHSCLFGGSP